MKPYVPYPTSPKDTDSLIKETEHRLFAFACTPKEGSLADREIERRIRAFFAVLASADITLSCPGTPSATPDAEIVIAHLCDVLHETYRDAKKELSTKNVLGDVFSSLAQSGYSLVQRAK